MSADEEKTKVLPRKPAVAVPAAADGDRIVFRCPNGHRIVVPASQAGKRGACSKCRIPVTIPTAGGGKGGSPVPSPTPTPPEIPAVEIGPVEAMPAAADEAVAGPPVGPEPPAVAEEENWSFIGGPSEGPVVSGSGTAWTAAEPTPGLDAEGGNPTSVLVARLWAERQHGGIIELHLDGGSVILPEWYDVAWSRGTHGLFASQAADGSVTLTAVAWDTVRKVVVRQLSEVPDDMFT